MSQLPPSLGQRLTLPDGQCLLSGPFAVLKAVLEADSPVSLITGPDQGSFQSLYKAALQETVAELLQKHGTACQATLDAQRGLTLAFHAARAGRAAVACVPNDSLDSALPMFARISQAAFDRSGAMCIIAEDHPARCAFSSPRHVANHYDLPCIEPGDVTQFRDSIEQALRMSRSGRTPVMIVVHSSILQSAEMVEVHPNREVDEIDALLARRRRRRRRSSRPEAIGVLRMGRRMELNISRSLPSPGERLRIGFITVGPAEGALRHLIHVLQLSDRVPVLQLRLIHPIDHAAVERLMTRCAQVVILEPRPGEVEQNILAFAEQLRRQGQQPASIWGKSIPPPPESEIQEVCDNQHLHPSTLARNIVHLLHDIRPTVNVATQLSPEITSRDFQLTERGSRVGSAGALEIVRQVVADVDQWLREHTPTDEENSQPTALVKEGIEPAGDVARLVPVEIADARKFSTEIISSLPQAARDYRPGIFIIALVSPDQLRDVERLTTAIIPSRWTDRTHIIVSQLAPDMELHQTIRDAALTDDFTVIIVSDSSPPQYDLAGREKDLAEIDRLGFQPHYRVVWPTNVACAWPSTDPESAEELFSGRVPSALRSTFSMERQTSAKSRAFLFRIKPLLEQIDVQRTKPPARDTLVNPSTHLPLPTPQHGHQPYWRVHLAGYRGNPPGPATRILSEAGTLMGYSVKYVHHPATIGPGRRAWTQVLFTRPRENEKTTPLTTVIPFGEADLILGLDVEETLRALGMDSDLRVAYNARTCAVVNDDYFTDETETEHNRRVRNLLPMMLDETTRADHHHIAHCAGACRTWFHTDRVTDLVLLGIAFQLGYLPLTWEVLESAVQRIEAEGIGRSHEGIMFGRRLAVDQRFFTPESEDPGESVARLLGRLERHYSRGPWWKRSHGHRFIQLMHRSLDQMPGLAETDPGRIARKEVLLAMYRCLQWGGISYAEQFIDLIVQLYHKDRGDKGRSITRNAVLPLAEAMLIHDLIYVATMATSVEHHRRTRKRLDIKRAREDKLERRYLTRIECVAFGRRYRADLRSSDWPARIVAWIRRFIPIRWRGSRRDRDIRTLVIEFIRNSIDGIDQDYGHFDRVMKNLHSQAKNNRLRGMALSELRMLLDVSSSPPVEENTTADQN